MNGHEVHFLIRERIAIFEVRRWIAVNYPAPCRRIVSSARRTQTRPLIVANDIRWPFSNAPARPPASDLIDVVPWATRGRSSL
jgi:hypothetical protein